MTDPVLTGRVDDDKGRPRNVYTFPGFLSDSSAFGEQMVAELEPFIQASANYDLVPANFREFSATGGSTGASGGMFFAQTGTSVGGYGALQSFRSLNYKAGQGGTARFTGLFTTGVANSWQGVGLISVGDELSFGYNGEDFGVWHRHGGLPEIRTVTVTGAAGGSENLTLTLNGTGFTIPLTSGSTAHNAWEISDWINGDATAGAIWHADNVDSTVIITALSDGAKSGTYSFASSSATGTIAQTTAGVTKTSDHIAQSSWNLNTFPALDPTKGNVYQIEYQYLGFGAITFSVEDGESGAFITVHRIQYPNTATTPSLGNPSLRLGLYAVSLGSTTDLTVKSASMAGYIQGKATKTRNPRAVDHTQSLGNSAETTLIALRNRKTYNGKFNQVEIEPELLTVANEGSKNVKIKVRATTDPGVELLYTAAGTNLVSDVATDSRTFSSGRVLASTVVAGGDNISIDLMKLQIRMPPTLHLIVTGFKSSGAAADVTASLTYYEDL